MTLADLPGEVDELPFVEWLEGQLEQGARLTEVANLVGITRAQLNELRKNEPTVKRAVDRGLALFHGFLSDRLREIIACGSERNSMTAAFFLLKSRFAYIDSPKPDPAEAVVNVRLELPQAFASTREYERARLAEPELAARVLSESDEEEPA